MFARFRPDSPEPDQPKKERIRPKAGEIRRLIGYLKPYKGRMTVAVIALTLGAGVGLAFPWFIQNLIDAVLAREDLAELNRITVLLLVIFLIRSIFYYFQMYSLSFVGESIVVDLREQTYQHLHTLSLRFFNDRRVGELISRLSSDVTVVRTALTSNIATVLSQSLTFIGSLVLMLILDWRLTLFILVLAPAVILTAAVFGRRMRKLSTDVQDELAESTSLAEEALSGIRVVKAFNREPYEVQRYDDRVERTFDVTMGMTRLRAAFSPLISFLAFSSLAAILWFGGREVIAGRLTAGSLIAFLIYGMNIGTSLGAFTSLYTQLQESVGASKRIFELQDEIPEVADAEDAHELTSVKGQLTFQRVYFAYPDSDTVLENIELDIQPGEVLALVGPSGAGKTTMFNLIPRFYDPTEGWVRVDGTDLREVTQQSLRANIALVPQETHLFSGSVYENIRYGNLTASDGEIEAAARAANAEDFINELPKGYETQVGERGIKLSGGQRQRISIARAILKDPRILLLDEATSSLDSESESLVQEALERLMQGRTTVIIAHRLSTVHIADRIVVLNRGRIIELGSHAELMAADGLYARLYKMQSRALVGSESEEAVSVSDAFVLPTSAS